MHHEWAANSGIEHVRQVQKRAAARDRVVSQQSHMKHLHDAEMRFGDGLHPALDLIRRAVGLWVGYNCKHAVATVAEYLQMLSDGNAVPQADPNDPRWDKLSGADEEYEDDSDDWDDEELDDWDEGDEGDADDELDVDSAPW